jgi:3',5'-cyclic AMP phosphodiesterase CpdA
MQRVVHLSDLHLGAGADQDREILDPLIVALAAERATWRVPPALLAITGDLYDTTRVDVPQATFRFIALLARIHGALGAEVPTLIVPGNHDRRTSGLVRPFQTTLIDTLVAARLPGVIVGGAELPFLGQLVDDAFHGLPCAVALVDSSYTPTGFISAGGLLRVEDLLELAERMEARGDGAERPLLLLTHHHLVPTPVTDTARIDADTTNVALRWLAKNVLPRIISYADHEEWMMTALGAGSALSTLQAFGRPVFVLHGHKHYPTVRTLRASLVGQGDLVLLAAGSAGLALSLDDGDEESSALLWPSFHVVEIEGPAVHVRTVAYFDDAPRATRTLLRVVATGAGWRVDEVDDRITHQSPKLLYNESHFALRPCATRPGARWDVDAVRRVKSVGELVYREHLRAAPGARYVAAEGPSDPETRSIVLPTDGRELRYSLVGGAARSVREALEQYGPTAPHEGVELLCRYESAEARLSLRGLPVEARPFGSVIDLTRGRTMPEPLVRRGDGAVEMVVRPCPPRTRLRIQWRPS